MSRRTGLFLLVAAAGFFLYLWPALRAPVVVWSDSEVDLTWAREGTGLWKPLTRDEGWRTVHPLKPGYILYLRLASRVIPSVGEARSAVIVQSLLVWASIAAASFALARRRGIETGIASSAILLLFLPLRNSASTVMSEPISAALLLSLVAVTAVVRPRSWPGIGLLALGFAVLFSIRPNVGAIGFFAAVVLYLLRNEIRQGFLLAIVSFCLVLAGWLVARPLSGGAEAPGVEDILIFGSAEYDWRPAVGDWPKAGERGFWEDPRTRRAIENWRTTLAANAPDMRRELIWRALHGLFGQDFYDARWSEIYRAINSALRLAAPFLVLGSIAALLAARGRGLVFSSLMIFLLVVHNLLFASSPRLMLPFVPSLVILGIESLSSTPRRHSWALRTVVIFVVLFALFGVGARHVLSWDWGAIESPRVTLRQNIPRRALPSRTPATLHLRIAPTDPGSQAHFIVRVRGRDIYRSFEEPARQRPLITIRCPEWLLDANGREPLEVEIVSTGSFAPYHLIFPVIPPPFGRGARRDGGRLLSPATDIRSGSFDWWAHAGVE